MRKNIGGMRGSAGHLHGDRDVDGVVGGSCRAVSHALQRRYVGQQSVASDCERSRRRSQILHAQRKRASNMMA